jgi:hypothetical protein
MTSVKRRVENLEKKVGTDSVTVFVYDNKTEAGARAALTRDSRCMLIVQSDSHESLVEDARAANAHIVQVSGINLGGV